MGLSNQYSSRHRERIVKQKHILKHKNV